MQTSQSILISPTTGMLYQCTLRNHCGRLGGAVYRAAACDVTDFEFLLISMENLLPHGKNCLRRTARSRSSLTSLDVGRTMVIRRIEDL